MNRPSASTASSACASRTTWSSPKPAHAGLQSRPTRSTIPSAWRSKDSRAFPSPSYSEIAMPFDLVLRGGRVIDPSQKLDAVTDVAFAGGKVAMVGSELKADAGTDVRDVSGYLVTPGLIDLHTHVYWGGTSLGIDAEEFCRTSGVTTAIDTGSAGPGNFAGFRKHVIEPSQVRILAYLHVSHAGIYGFSQRVMVG